MRRREERNVRPSFSCRLLAVVVLSACAAAPRPPAASEEPTARELLHEAVAVARERALGAGAVDWLALERELAAGLAPEAGARAAWPALARVVAALGDPHARFHPAEEVEAWSSAPAGGAAVAAADAPATERVPLEPEGRHLADGTAYLVVPGCGASESGALRAWALALRRLVLELGETRPPGWIVDLRFDGGGNVWPMLVGLRPLLGDGEAARSVLPDGSRVRSGCDGARAWIDFGGGPRTQLEIEPPEGDRLVEHAPIAVLVHGWTMSSGELVALALGDLDRARTFGEPTAGLTSATEHFPLSDGSLLVLPTSRLADRFGRVLAGALEPDERVDSSAWPGPEDAVATAAWRWLATR